MRLQTEASRAENTAWKVAEPEGEVEEVGGSLTKLLASNLLRLIRVTAKDSEGCTCVLEVPSSPSLFLPSSSSFPPFSSSPSPLSFFQPSSSSSTHQPDASMLVGPAHRGAGGHARVPHVRRGPLAARFLLPPQRPGRPRDHPCRRRPRAPGPRDPAMQTLAQRTRLTLASRAGWHGSGVGGQGDARALAGGFSGNVKLQRSSRGVG